MLERSIGGRTPLASSTRALNAQPGGFVAQVAFAFGPQRREMGFQERLDVGRRSGRDRPIDPRRGTVVAELVEDRAVHDFLDVAEPARHVRAIKHAVVVDQLDDDPAGCWVDRSVSQGGRQRRDGVDLLGAERTVAR